MSVQSAAIQVLKEAGLKRINISLDSLNPETYKTITRGGDLMLVLEGIDRALEAGFPVKINTVLTGDLNLDEVDRFIEFALAKGVEVRFIERMSFEDNDPFISQEQVLSIIGKNHRVKELADESGSPHVRLFDCDTARIGFISPRSLPFCDRCNKLRLMPNGQLKMCLASDSHVDVRGCFAGPTQIGMWPRR